MKQNNEMKRQTCPYIGLCAIPPTLVFWRTVNVQNAVVTFVSNHAVTGRLTDFSIVTDPFIHR